MATAHPISRSTARVSTPPPMAPLVVSVLSVVALVVSLAGTTWIFSPADPAAKTPAAELSFSDLNTLFGTAGVPTTWEQHHYFAWMAWVLLALVVVTAAAALLTRQRAAAAALLVVGVVGLVLTVFAFKGELTWQQYWDGHANLRLGGYLVFLGFILAIVAGALLARRPAADRLD